MSDEVPTSLGELPDAVRARIVSMAAEVLPDVVRLPPSLRRVAEFAPARRARLGGTAIASALGSDEEFRERVATQVGTRTPPESAEPVDVAALSWLARPEGWEAAVADAVRRVQERAEGGGRDTSELERLRQKLAEAEQAVRDLRALHRAQVEEYKAENTSLRRKLGESRSAERAARAAADEAERVAEETRGRSAAQAVAREKELRQLRGQIAQREAEDSADRRADRTERDETTLRARLLLDTVIDAASGLRRELGLPPTTGAPGDRVEAGLAEDDARGASPVGARGGASPALLEQYLSMPRARLIIDGYNVSKTAWPTSSLEAQRIRLLNGLAPLVARTGVEATVVFDAAASSVRPVVKVPRGVKVLFSPEGVIADDVIRDLVAAEPVGRVVVVVTSDRAVAEDVARSGARPMASNTLVAVLST